MKTPKARHVPSNDTTDSGETLRAAAAQSAGFRMGVDLFTAREQIEAGGGPRGILQRAIERTEKAGNQ